MKITNIKEEENKIRNLLDKEKITYMMNYSFEKNLSEINIMGDIYNNEIIIELCNLGCYFVKGSLVFNIKDE